MEFVASFWWIWLMLFIVSIGSGVVINILAFRDVAKTITTGASGILKNDSGRMASAVGDLIEGVQSRAFSRIWKFVFITLLGWTSGILLIISVIINALRYFS